MNNSTSVIESLRNYLNEKCYLVFDFDKTIAQMEIDWSGWYPGMSAVYEQFDKEGAIPYGVNPHTHHNQLVDTYGVSLAEAANDFNEKYELANLTHFTPHRELVEFISTLDEKIALFIYSSNSRSTVVRGVNEMGIANKFKKIVTRNDVLHVKPHPEGFDLIPGIFKNRQKFLMVGDSGSDRGVAEAVGIDFLETNYFEKYSFE